MEKLTACLTLILLQGCANVMATGTTDAGCTFYAEERRAMPDVTATGPFLRWFDGLDSGMLEACQ